MTIHCLWIISRVWEQSICFGANVHYKEWNFNTAFQIPFVNLNKNSYFKEYGGTTDFPSTNLFERKPDALVRATYSIKTSNPKFTFKPNLLFIYHLGEDSFENCFWAKRKDQGFRWFDR